jgi:predicted RNase H-like nuclease (RuvC/YqgF family)
LKGFPEETVETENQRLNDQREGLRKQKADLEQRLKKCQEAVFNRPNTERFISLLRQKIVELDYTGKRLALQALNIKVWVDGNNIEITGSIPVEQVVAVSS